jgi:hypothetical protein
VLINRAKSRRRTLISHVNLEKVGIGKKGNTDQTES